MAQQSKLFWKTWWLFLSSVTEWEQQGSEDSSANIHIQSLDSSLRLLDYQLVTTLGVYCCNKTTVTYRKYALHVEQLGLLPVCSMLEEVFHSISSCRSEPLYRNLHIISAILNLCYATTTLDNKSKSKIYSPHHSAIQS